MSAFLAHAAATLARGGRVSGLPEGAAAWAVAQSVRGPTWVVLPTPEEAERFARALAFWLDAGGPASSDRVSPACHRVRVLPWPADDLPPYSGVSPHPGHVRDRIVALDALRRQEHAIVVAPAEALLERVPEPDVLAPAVLEVTPGRALPRAMLLATLARFGYLSAALVEDPGTWAVRGGVVDVWPTGEPTPVRIDLFDEEVETLRRFDPATQRSGVVLPALRVLPARLWSPDAAAVERLAEATRIPAGTQRDAMALRRRVLETLGSRLAFAGVEDWIAGLHPVASPLDHAPSTILALDADRMVDPVEDLAQRAAARWSDLGCDERPLVPPEDRFDPPDDLIARLEGAPGLETLPVEDPDRPTLVLGVQGTADLAVTGGELAPFVAQLGRWLEDGWRVALVAPGRADAERLLALLAPHGVQPEEVAHRDPDRLRAGRV
ncbi:MAG: hypothetical protein JXB39_01845, partial [Deltaproteobacteria bacterium]|nr:hypothetical protein [Deltaproteobacteria bacterium]